MSDSILRNTFAHLEKNNTAYCIDKIVLEELEQNYPHITNFRLNKRKDIIGDCSLCNAQGVGIKTHGCNPLAAIPGNLEASRAEVDKDLCYDYITAYNRAKERGIEFTLSLKKYKSLMKIKYCYYSGILLTNGSTSAPTYRTLERLDSEGPYSDDNVVACCQRLNQAKTNLSPKDIKDIYNGLKRKGLL